MRGEGGVCELSQLTTKVKDHEEEQEEEVGSNWSFKVLPTAHDSLRANEFRGDRRLDVVSQIDQRTEHGGQPTDQTPVSN